jgi:HK97 gp10 family phage protein
LNVSIDISQLKELSKKLEQAGEKTIKMAELEVKATAMETLQIAKILAPVDRGGLVGAMAMEAVNKLEYKIGNNKNYAPYVEFGTGSKAYIPDDFKEMAAKFKGSTGQTWENGLAEITKWCIAKGIPEEAAYPIFMSILKNGIYASPFLWPAFKFGRAELVDRITNVIKDFNLE